MIRFFWQSAHVASGNVQQMAIVFGAKSYSAAGQRPFVKNRDRQTRDAPQQIGGQHGSAEPAADHNYTVRMIPQKATVPDPSGFDPSSTEWSGPSAEANA
jgi:hypothetical protein